MVYGNSNSLRNVLIIFLLIFLSQGIYSQEQNIYNNCEIYGNCEKEGVIFDNNTAFVNESAHWVTQSLGTLSDANSTQFNSVAQVLNIDESWIVSLDFWERNFIDAGVLSPKTITDDIYTEGDLTIDMIISTISSTLQFDTADIVGGASLFSVDWGSATIDTTGDISGGKINSGLWGFQPDAIGFVEDSFMKVDRETIRLEPATNSLVLNDGDIVLNGLNGDITTIGDVHINSDSSKYFVGDADDFSIGFNGSSPIFKQEVGSTPWYFQNAESYNFDDDATIGSGEAGIDYILTFDGEDDDGDIKWDEDLHEWVLDKSLFIKGTDEVNGFLLDLVKTNYDLSTGVTQTAMRSTARAFVGGSRGLQSLQFDTRYTGSGTQTGVLAGVLGQIFHTGTGDTGTSRGVDVQMILSTNAIAAVFDAISVKGSIANTKTGTIGQYAGFRDLGVDAEDGTVTTAYNFLGENHIKDSGSIGTAYGMRLKQQTNGNTNWQIFSSEGNMYMGNDNSLTMWGGNSRDLRISSDGTFGVIDVLNGLIVTNDVFIDGDLNVTGNITSANVFIPQYVFSHTNATIEIVGENVWTNVTFEQEEDNIKQGISHIFNDNSNDTYIINEDGIYEINFNFDIQDTSVGASDIDIAGRVISNEVEIEGSVFENDIIKQAIEYEIVHTFLARLNSGDEIKFQFIADDEDVVISTHASFGDHPDSATIIIKKIANL